MAAGIVAGTLPLTGVDAGVTTIVNELSLETSWARNRIFGTCNPIIESDKHIFRGGT